MYFRDPTGCHRVGRVQIERNFELLTKAVPPSHPSHFFSSPNIDRKNSNSTPTENLHRKRFPLSPRPPSPRPPSPPRLSQNACGVGAAPRVLDYRANPPHPDPQPLFTAPRPLGRRLGGSSGKHNNKYLTSIGTTGPPLVSQNGRCRTRGWGAWAAKPVACKPICMPPVFSIMLVFEIDLL